jgi:hypothetical protein
MRSLLKEAPSLDGKTLKIKYAKSNVLAAFFGE